MDVANEVPVQSPNSFGPVPPGDFMAPSYEESVQISINWAVDWVLRHADRPIIAVGYSQGGEAASKFRMEFEAGGRLSHLYQNWVCGVALGNPARNYEHTYYAGPNTPWEGIAQWRMPDEIAGDDWCDLIDPGDMYGTCMRGLSGEIQRDVYTLCTQMEMHSGGVEFCKTLIANTLEVIRNLDGDAYDDMQAGLSRYGIDLSGANIARHDVLQSLSDKLLSVEGIACAIAAAIDALIFFCTTPPTASHIEYHIRQVWPGMTYLGLSIQHIHDWVRTYQGAQ